jgi:hypothetical protein
MVRDLVSIDRRGNVGFSIHCGYNKDPWPPPFFFYPCLKWVRRKTQRPFPSPSTVVMTVLRNIPRSQLVGWPRDYLDCLLLPMWRGNSWLLAYFRYLKLYNDFALEAGICRTSGIHKKGALVLRVRTYIQIFLEVVGLERGSLSLVSTIDELLERKSNGSGQENRDYGRRGSAVLTTRHPLFSEGWH